MEQISKELLDILACPKCRKPVTINGDTLRCINKNCGLAYPIRNGIPVMLIEEAVNSPESGQ